MKERKNENEKKANIPMNLSSRTPQEMVVVSFSIFFLRKLF